MTILQKIECAFAVIAFFIIFALWGTTDYFRNQAEKLETQLQDCEAAMDTIQQAATEREKRAQEAYEEAQTQFRKVNDDTTKILTTEVPTDCEAAIAWGALAANNFN